MIYIQSCIAKSKIMLLPHNPPAYMYMFPYAYTNVLGKVDQLFPSDMSRVSIWYHLLLFNQTDTTFHIGHGICQLIRFHDRDLMI